jgi:hypothetical protein
MFIEGTQQTKSLSIRQSFAYTLAAQDLLAVHFVALEDFRESVLLWRITRLSVVNLFWLLNRIVASHFHYFLMIYLLLVLNL